MPNMFKASDPVVVWDGNSVLPPQGENSRQVTLVRDTVTIDIYFDGEEFGTEKFVSLTFYSVSSVYDAIFPGVNSLMIDYARSEVGGLVEYRSSQAADAWSKYCRWSERRTRHYQIVLQEAGHRCDIFAEAHEVSAIMTRSRDKPDELQ